MTARAGWRLPALLLSLGLPTAASAADIIFVDEFTSIVTTNESFTNLGGAPTGWQVRGAGSVDSYAHINTNGTPCYTAGGCVDLDGSTYLAGPMFTTQTFDLEAGKTYQLSAHISGNQQSCTPGPCLYGATDAVLFGFGQATGLLPLSLLPTSTLLLPAIAASSPYTLYSLLYTPTSNQTATLFFHNLGGHDLGGPMLGRVELSVVPLPASAWLFMSALLLLGLMARRQQSVLAAAS